MTLSFRTEINGKPNEFIEKIWESLLVNGLATISEYQNHRMDFTDRFGKDWTLLQIQNKTTRAKCHTIRHDKEGRWKEGNRIQPIINNRTPDRFQFAPDFKCTGTQTIIIEPKIDKVGHFRPNRIIIDGRFLSNDEISDIAINDGFETMADFFAYFNTNFEGKLIHWTEKRY